MDILQVKENLSLCKGFGSNAIFLHRDIELTGNRKERGQTYFLRRRYICFAMFYT